MEALLSCANSLIPFMSMGARGAQEQANAAEDFTDFFNEMVLGSKELDKAEAEVAELQRTKQDTPEKIKKIKEELGQLCHVCEEGPLHLRRPNIRHSAQCPGCRAEALGAQRVPPPPPAPAVPARRLR